MMSVKIPGTDFPRVRAFPPRAHRRNSEDPMDQWLTFNRPVPLAHSVKKVTDEMCTICGHFTAGAAIPSTDIYDMLRKMEHRGPDTHERTMIGELPKYSSMVWKRSRM